MAVVRYRTPYELVVNAVDLGSGKRTTNIYYYRSAFYTGAPPPYGGPVIGSDSATLLAAFVTRFEANILPIMNHNYQMISYVMRAIIGKQYKTPFIAIGALTPGAPIVVDTVAPHGLVTGNFVYVQGVTSPPGANGVFSITRIDPTSFALNGSNDALFWSGDGQIQQATGSYQFQYADTTTQLSVAVGGIAGDSLPMFACASVRRLNSGIGKSFRSRVSLSPMSESDVVDGRFTAIRLASINTAFATLIAVNLNNGGADVTGGVSAQTVISKKIASTLPLVFTSENPWSVGTVSFSCQPNLGSLVRRKPKLTAPIT